MKPRVGELCDLLLQLLVALAQGCQRADPGRSTAVRHFRPVLFRGEVDRRPANAAQDHLFPGAHVEHDLPDAVCLGNRLLRRLRGADSLQHVEYVGAVPCLAMEGAAVLIGDSLRFPHRSSRARVFPVRTVSRRGRLAAVRPRLLTFDIFGTVLDWRRGLREATAAAGIALDDAAFDRVIDAQAADEAGPFRTYAEIAARSLTGVLGMAAGAAASIAAAAGTWPLYSDSREALRRMQSLVPCAATTNSDRSHGEQGPWWWHVSAYGDYDLETARSLGLTCVYVRRPHARPGPSDLAVADLAELADRVAGAVSAAAIPPG